MAHGALSYTNGAAATDDGRVYAWGGNCWQVALTLTLPLTTDPDPSPNPDPEPNCWQGGIAAGRSATGPTEVAWGGVPRCYRCSSVALGHQHGFLIFEKRP
jgi:hypothetical protein